MANRKPTEPGAFTGNNYLPYLSIYWGLPEATIQGWVSSGLLQRNRSGFVDRAMVLRFVNSAEGQSALALARNG